VYFDNLQFGNSAKSFQIYIFIILYNEMLPIHFLDKLKKLK